LGDEVVSAPIVLEGGSIHTDGAGTLLTTEECLLNPNRNPSFSRDQIEHALRQYLGARRIVWLGKGLVEDRDTDGHIDLIAAFTGADGDQQALATIDAAFPGREVVSVPGDVLAYGGGGPHCITQQVPTRDA